MEIVVDLKTLVKDAERTNGIIEFVPQVGDFVALDEPPLQSLRGSRKA